MQIKMFKALWGMTGEYEEQLERIAEAGYIIWKRGSGNDGLRRLEAR